MQCAWCDALFAQAVADCENVAIHIIESHKNFAEETLIQWHRAITNLAVTKTRQNYSKICGNKPRHNEPHYNEFSAITKRF